MRSRVLLSLCVLALSMAEARAHFLFVRVLPQAEAGRWAEVYFSELAEAGDPRFIHKLNHTQLYVQYTPGEFQPLKVQAASDRLRAYLPASGSVAVVGVCTYGVLGGDKRPAFLLRHYPKAIAGSPADLNKMRPYAKVPFEILTTIDGDRITFTALRDGKPVPRAEFITVDTKLHNETLTADAEGRATWKPGPGRYSVYTRQTLKESGSHDNRKYEEIRDFTTVSFTWPLERKGADPKAVALFEEAVAARAQWKDFPGFTAQIAGQVDGRPFAGDVTVRADGAVVLDTKEEVAYDWVKEQLESIVMHRGAAPSDGTPTKREKPVLRFADEREDHPLGRLLVFEGGRFASSYRVKDRQILVVNRQVGKQHMTITVLENDRSRDGAFLPRSYTVQYWDAATGDLARTETISDRWERLGTWDLPAQHAVTAASEAGLTVRTFTLSKHQLLKSE